jgi:hypothetical protein
MEFKVMIGAGWEFGFLGQDDEKMYILEVDELRLDIDFAPADCCRWTAILSRLFAFKS